MLDGSWQGTMCLTEPNFGSDTGDIITRSYPNDDPRIWKIKGTKMFITAGDRARAENTIHLLLARPKAERRDRPASAVHRSKYWVNEGGSLGESNDVTTVGVEHRGGSTPGHGAFELRRRRQLPRHLLGPLPTPKATRRAGHDVPYDERIRIGTGHNANTQGAAAYCFAPSTPPSASREDRSA
jgi:hypothetical protein